MNTEKEIEYEEECGCEFCSECDDEEIDESKEFDAEISDSEEEENRLIIECLDFIFESETCMGCKIGKITELAYRFKEIGWVDHQDYIREMNED
jgi:hypothetical protein